MLVHGCRTICAALACLTQVADSATERVSQSSGDRLEDRVKRDELRCCGITTEGRTGAHCQPRVQSLSVVVSLVDWRISSTTGWARDDKALFCSASMPTMAWLYEVCLCGSTGCDRGKKLVCSAFLAEDQDPSDMNVLVASHIANTPEAVVSSWVQRMLCQPGCTELADQQC